MTSNKNQYQGIAMNISENTSECLSKSHLSSNDKGKLKSQNTSNHLTDPNVSEEFLMSD